MPIIPLYVIARTRLGVVSRLRSRDGELQAVSNLRTSTWRSSMNKPRREVFSGVGIGQ